MVSPLRAIIVLALFLFPLLDGTACMVKSTQSNNSDCDDLSNLKIKDIFASLQADPMKGKKEAVFIYLNDDLEDELLQHLEDSWETVGEGASGVIYGLPESSDLPSYVLRVFRDEKGPHIEAIRETVILSRMTFKSEASARPTWTPLRALIFGHVGAYLLFDRYEGDLVHYLGYAELGPEKQMNMKNIRQVMRDVLLTLSSLHHAGLAHRDVKLDNILIKSVEKAGSTEIDNQAYLGDYGHVRGTTGPYHASGSYEYMPPEVSAIHMYVPADEKTIETLHRAADAWAAGVTLMAMLEAGTFREMRRLARIYQSKHGIDDVTGLVRDVVNPFMAALFGTLSPEGVHTPSYKLSCELIESMKGVPPSFKHIEYVRLSNGDAPSDIQQAKELLRDLLIIDPMDRLSVDEALQYPFFDQAVLSSPKEVPIMLNSPMLRSWSDKFAFMQSEDIADLLGSNENQYLALLAPRSPYYGSDLADLTSAPGLKRITISMHAVLLQVDPEQLRDGAMTIEKAFPTLVKLHRRGLSEVFSSNFDKMVEQLDLINIEVRSPEVFHFENVFVVPHSEGEGTRATHWLLNAKYLSKCSEDCGVPLPRQIERRIAKQHSEELPTEGSTPGSRSKGLYSFP